MTDVSADTENQNDSAIARCGLCGEPMPPGEQMFQYHGYSGPCPKPPLPKPRSRVKQGKVADLRDKFRDAFTGWLEMEKEAA
jgi:hypothetical protein